MRARPCQLQRAVRPSLRPPPPLPETCSQKLDGPYDNRVLPVVLTCVLMTFLTVVWIGSIVRCVCACVSE